MKIKIIISIVIILSFIISTYILISSKEPIQPNQNNKISIIDLYNNPVKYLNNTINITGKIEYGHPDNFASGYRYFQNQIKREYLFTPLKNDTWVEYSNGHSVSSLLFIEIYSNNLTFSEYLRKEIILTGYFREFPVEYHYEDSIPDKYYIEVINITIIN